jgi:hypothetical protein
MSHEGIAFRLIIVVQLLAMGAVRAYFGAPRAEKPVEPPVTQRAEFRWFTVTLGGIALLHFGAIVAYLANPPLLGWSAFEVAVPIRWLGILISCLGVGGEIWAAV